MKYILTLLGILSFTMMTFFSFAQKESKKKHEYHYRIQDPVETDTYKIVIEDAHSQAKFTSVRISVTNKTSDILVFRPSEILFKYEHGEFKVEEKEVMIKPNGTVSRLLKTKGGKQFHVKNMSLVVDCLYLLAVNKKVVAAPDFDLPASVDSFRAGGFQVSLKKLIKKTDETVASFTVISSGTDYGIVTTGVSVIKLEDKQEFPSADSNKTKSRILNSGDEMNLTVIYKVPVTVTDMQFANMKIVWKGTFSESKAVKLKGQTFNLEIDPGLTDGKNN
ncbi:MAG: hypothetical protein COB85_02945 [Bacteroidetes bacterium]|nr:MAG: hypothetical protein COB85_02945 [Bacteroidota bacterium]